MGDNTSTAWETPAERFALQSRIGKALCPELHGQMPPPPFLRVAQFEDEAFEQALQAGVDVGRGKRKLHAPALHRVPFRCDRHRDLGLALEISVDRAGAEPGLLNDVLHGCCMKTLARKHVSAASNMRPRCSLARAAVILGIGNFRKHGVIETVALHVAARMSP